MRSPTFLTDPLIKLVADSSTIINLIATGCAPAIISALPNRIVAVDLIPGELDTGRKEGHPHADALQTLVEAQRIEIVQLGDIGWQHFETLVVGHASETLDDGEAATIAFAAEHGAVAVIDEKKGTRLCRKHFPGVGIASTVDVLLHPNIRRTLGDAPFADAIYMALRDARMAASPDNLDEVVCLIGSERAADA